MNNALRRAIFVFIAGMGFAAASAFGEVTVSITISGTVDELAPVLQHLKDMGIGVGKGAAAPSDGVKTEIHSSMSAPGPVGPALNAQNLTGTFWEAGGHKMALNPDGKLKVNDSIDGTWKVEGNTLKISAMGQDMDIEIQGDKLLFRGRPLNKIDKPAEKPAEAPKPATAAPSAPAPAAAPMAPAPAGAALNAQTLVGTIWEGGGYRSVFGADGKIKINDNMDGTWKVDGKKVKISIGGDEVEVDIDGDKLSYEGQALTRVQPAKPAAPAAGVALDAQTLVGTKWEGGKHTSVFNADGKLKVDDTIDGTWKVEGNKVKISAAGNDIELDIKGDVLSYQDHPLTKK